MGLLASAQPIDVLAAIVRLARKARTDRARWLRPVSNRRNTLLIQRSLLPSVEMCYSI